MWLAPRNPGMLTSCETSPISYLSVEAYDKFREVRHGVSGDNDGAPLAAASRPAPLPQTAMRLTKLVPSDPRYPAWVALAYHALVSEAPSVPAGTAPPPPSLAPHPITGGGRGWGLGCTRAVRGSQAGHR